MAKTSASWQKEWLCVCGFEVFWEVVVWGYIDTHSSGWYDEADDADGGVIDIHWSGGTCTNDVRRLYHLLGCARSCGTAALCLLDLGTSPYLHLRSFGALRSNGSAAVWGLSLALALIIMTDS